ncbi:MAG: amidohydrolase [Clostridiales bacterium]|jgi:aminobenzoyl-glutamate utilization protein B|nr:amidohydrolase [Clostridiales bacterium]
MGDEKTVSVQELKKAAVAFIDEKKTEVLDVNDRIWEFAELSLMETRSMALYCEVLERNGFAVERGICDVPTAFSGTFGSGGPIIGILAEYDALSGLSQAGATAVEQPLTQGAPGHGCGHNMLGAGSLAAAFAVKKFLEDAKVPGTVIFYGCPGEEGGAGKAFMARAGLWKKLDAALTWHPSETNEVVSGSSNSSIQIEYRYKGVASHAAGDPELGRSALDAVELLNIGVQFLREHIPDNARVHYAIIDGGGVSPNVVQPTASVLYMIRENTVHKNLGLVARVDKIAEGAALMTDTRLERVFIDGTADTIPNFTLEKALYKNFQEIGVPKYTDEELAFAAAVKKTYDDRVPSRLPGGATDTHPEIEAFVREASRGGTLVMNDFLIPQCDSRHQSMGSTDVADVSWLTPTGQIHVAARPHNAPGHSWQVVSCGKSTIGHKAVLFAGKVLAATAIDLLLDPETLLRAKAEHAEKTKAGYLCPIPDGEPPRVPGE